ncbi:sushi, nidogen and EGF-like domain-containing protein 1 isoform X2 [Alosa pseudoharengus]|uniref:sushi, nidogen and EGF-like domain-containing protein 1 isoform X2 n=1 Tax=Alosa pseudoharengus TaxID=34774 RepID=UPI003F8A79FE
MIMMTPLSLTLIMVAMSGSTSALDIFYPFGSAAGDTDAGRSDDGSSPLIPLRRSFPYFGRTYQQIYVNHNGHLTFNQSLSTFTPTEFPENSTRDIIAPFWTDLDNSEKGNISYQQYTTGGVLKSATQDINSYFPNVPFTATWVFVATWDRVAYYPNTGTETTFQVVLISDSNLSFVFMNYGVIAQTEKKVQIGYDTIGSTHYGSLRTCYPNNTIDIVNLHNSSNIDVQGRWVFATFLRSEGFRCTINPANDDSADNVIGMRLEVSTTKSLSEADIEEQILKPFGDLLKKHGINVTGIRLRTFYKTEL